MKAGNYLGSDDQHIVENENFRKVDPEKDLKRWEAAESNAEKIISDAFSYSENV